MPEVVPISVRTLVEYVYRSGSIETGFRSSTALIEGTKAHQAIQSAYRVTDLKEIHLQGDMECGDFVFRLEGRCDGLLRDDDEWTVEEIKSTSGDLARIEDHSYPVHWAQAYCYAYLYASAEGLLSMNIKLTYIQVQSGERKSFLRKATLAELQTSIREMVEAYSFYATLQVEHAKIRDRSIKELPFPYETYRQGQRKFAGAVYRTISDNKKLFAKAPTGTGKTVSVLFPAVKAIGEGKLLRFFYVTAKTTTRAAAEEALALMQSKGLRLRTVTITAKEKICFQEEVRCSKENCEFADGHYDRINGAILDLLANEMLVTRETIESYARKHRVCPFEFSLDAAYAADAVICDYNYVFDPRVSLKRLPEEQKKRIALLADEAHNLVDRARDMYSAELAKSPFLDLKREYKKSGSGVGTAASAVNDFFITLRKRHKEVGRNVSPHHPEELLPLLESFITAAESELGGERGSETQQLLLDAYFAAQTYIRTAGYFDERYVAYIETFNSDVRLKLFCLDPSGMLRQMGKGYGSHVFFSATLSPLGYYRDMLGGNHDDYAFSIPSPFRKDQLRVRVLPLSTRYRDRESTREPIDALLREMLRERRGNILVFFPSYEYMNLLVGYIQERGLPEADLLVQQSGMEEEERSAFLAEFQAGRCRALVGLAVMGGVFSEGVDLTGDRLNAVVVIGVGLPQIGLERDILKRHFDENGKNGFDYAYVYPGINKVLQAGGRLIRTDEDTGTLVLVDDRFLQPKYEGLLPEEWKPLDVVKLAKSNTTGRKKPTW